MHKENHSPQSKFCLEMSCVGGGESQSELRAVLLGRVWVGRASEVEKLSHLRGKGTGGWLSAVWFWRPVLYALRRAMEALCGQVCLDE